MKIKYTLLFLVIILNNSKALAQSEDGDGDERVFFNSIVYLKDSVVKKENNYEIYIKDISTGKIKPFKYAVTGSGFFVSKDLDSYLVTANHVANQISLEGEIYFQNVDNEKRSLKLKELVNKNSTWISHPTADVSVLRLNINEKDSMYLDELGISSFSYSSIKNELTSPNRLQDLTIFGFPLSLGAMGNQVSPITKKLKAASDILYLNRFDNKVANAFYLLDDPSISGFSGGPVVIIKESYENPYSNKRVRMSPDIVGLVHGTINDKTGGFAAIVPAKFIAETIDLAPSFNGKYVYYYSTGKIWSERIYKNGFPWTVISNFDSKGIAQEMGTLKNGNGTLIIYNEKGEVISEDSYKKGIFQGSNYVNLKGL
ncbi:hypothetical protein [Maribacter sp. R86514]|uniref:hypothetical protein n=1 Tax=Maribacter sp. R86514 TaxID=3093854 RepID=UPI0037CA5109